MTEPCHLADLFDDCGPAEYWLTGHVHDPRRPCRTDPPCDRYHLCQRCIDTAVRCGEATGRIVIDRRGLHG